MVELGERRESKRGAGEGLASHFAPDDTNPSTGPKPDIDLTVRVKKPLGLPDVYNTNIVLQDTYNHLVFHVGDQDQHGELVKLQFQAAGVGLPACTRIDTTPKVTSREEDRFTMLGKDDDGNNKRQTVNFIDPGDKATGQRSYIVDILTGQFAVPLPGSEVSYFNPGSC